MEPPPGFEPGPTPYKGAAHSVAALAAITEGPILTETQRADPFPCVVARQHKRRRQRIST